ncbi:MAG: hypothetical protein V3S69_05310 [Dehalococcoidales bacterium]
MPKICRHSKVVGNLTEAEKEDLAKAFIRAKKPISSIRRLLESKIVQLDNKLGNTEGVHEHARPDLYIVALQAEKNAHMWMYRLLDLTVDDHQQEK